MKYKLLTSENLIRVSIVIVLVLFAGTEYDIKDVILGLLVVVGMFVFGACIVRIYQESCNYFRRKKWELSKQKTISFILVIVLISSLFFIFLSDKMMKHSFLSVGMILALLLIYDNGMKIIRRIF